MTSANTSRGSRSITLADNILKRETSKYLEEEDTSTSTQLQYVLCNCTLYQDRAKLIMLLTTDVYVTQNVFITATNLIIWLPEFNRKTFPTCDIYSVNASFI